MFFCCVRTQYSVHINNKVIFEYLGIALTNINGIIVYRIFHQKNIGMTSVVRCLRPCICMYYSQKDIIYVYVCMYVCMYTYT